MTMAVHRQIHLWSWPETSQTCLQCQFSMQKYQGHEQFKLQYNTKKTGCAAIKKRGRNAILRQQGICKVAQKSFSLFSQKLLKRKSSYSPIGGCRGRGSAGLKWPLLYSIDWAGFFGVCVKFLPKFLD